MNAILGTRGVPNHYGGFEQFANIYLKSLLKKVMKCMYNSQNHPFQKSEWNGMKLFIVKIPQILLELLVVYL